MTPESAAEPLVLDGGPLRLADVVAVARERRPVRLGALARERMGEARAAIERMVARDAPVYGLTTGVGVLRGIRIGAPDQERFNRAMIGSHIVGYGALAPADVVRAAMLVRAQGLSLAGAGVRPEIVEALCAALDAGLDPPVHVYGSMGQSDLGPLAEICFALMGQGPGGVRLGELGLRPMDPEARESLALINANAFSTGWACIALHDARRAVEALEDAVALTFEGFLGNPSVLDPAVAAARPHPGLGVSLRRLRSLLDGGEILSGEHARNLQDPISFRAAPQMQGTARETLDHAATTLERELASAPDNPLVVAGEERAISTGNFDAGLVSAALDYARLGLAQPVTAAGERVQKILAESFSGLPSGLRRRHDVPEDALAIVGTGAAALAGEARLLAAPVSYELPTSTVAAGIEDHITMAPVSARRLQEMAAIALRLAAVELVCAAQAVDVRERADRLAPGTRRLYQLVRSFTPFVDAGDPLPDVEGLAARLAGR